MQQDSHVLRTSRSNVNCVQLPPLCSGVIGEFFERADVTFSQRVFLLCPVLRADQFLSECVGGFERHWNAVFTEDSPESFQNSRLVRDRNVAAFVSILFFAGVSLFGGLCEGPVWVTACFERCFEIILFLLFPLGCGGHFFSPML